LGIASTQQPDGEINDSGASHKQETRERVLMTVIVTGGSGFIGTNLIQELIDRKVEVVNLDIQPPKLNAHFPLWKKISLLDKSEVRGVFDEIKPDYVIHAAARTDLGGRSNDDYGVNTTGTGFVLDAIEAVGTVRRALFMSSMLVCRNGYYPRSSLDYCPNTPYGESKAEMEKSIWKRTRIEACEFVVVRPTSVWGPWFADPYRQFFNAISKGVYFHPGNLQVTKQFGYVGNVVDQVITLLTKRSGECEDKVFYVGDYSAYVVRDWANLIQRELGARRIRTVPVPVLRPIAALGDLLVSLGWLRAPLTSFRLSNMLLNNSVPFDNTARVCGPLRYSVPAGVRQTVSWLQHQAS
jgi:nucleoside-diphosphate-sugar epimerase